MTKQEFMAMSLPYGLKIKSQHQIFTLHYYKDSVEIINDYEHISIGNLIQENEDKENKTEPHKPILRPLSDLTKEIDHKGEKFIPIDNIEGLFVEGTEDLINQSIEAIEYFIENNFFSRMEYLPFILINKLIEWHFDIAGLIDKGEAIDYSTLEGFSF